MTTKEKPSAEAHGALHTMKPVTVFSYMLGDFGCNLAFSLSTAWLLFYYTDVAGLNAGLIATTSFVVRLWDAFADLIAGRIVDQTMTRWGKFRPFILWFALPLLFLSFLTFYVPDNWKTEAWAGNYGPALLYAYLTYAVLGFFYSMVNIPYGSLASAMTQSIKERAKLVSWRLWGGAAAGLFLTAIIAPQISTIQRAMSAARIKATAGDAAAQAEFVRLQGDMQAVFTQITLWFVVLGGLCFLMVFLFCKEHVVRVSAKTTMRETVQTLKVNKPLQILCLSSLFYLTGVYAVGPISAYYARYYMGDTAHATTIAFVNSGVQLLVTPFIPWVIGKFGKKNLYQYCGLFTVIGGLALFFTPVGALWMALIFLAIKGVGASLINVAMFGLEADTVEYGEWKNGTRTEGATYAIYSFTRKVTQSFGGLIGGFLLAGGGYVANADTQNPNAMLAIAAAIGLVPAVVAIVAMLIFWKYPLTDAVFETIRNETESKKAARGHLVGPGGTEVDKPED